MNNLKLSFQEILPGQTSGLSKFDLSYLTQREIWLPLTDSISDTEQLERAIRERKNFKSREKLVEILRNQYRDFTCSEPTQKNIEALLHSNCFTVVCAHQPSLLGGPLYWVYKIISTIATCKRLNNQYPQYNFVPVYFAGNEDHDFEEINHLHIFSKKIVWNEQYGSAVGRLPVHNLITVFNEIKEIFKANAFAREFMDRQIQLAENADSYSTYFKSFVEMLFGKYGLIYFHPDDAQAKTLWTEVLLKELREEFIYNTCKKSCEDILKNGYSLQVHPREINLFYHHPTGRKRIVKIDSNHFELVDADLKWDAESIYNEAQQHPEHFSPNVMLRPVYQELLFPNVAFIGGAAEINYWLQLYSAFQALKIPFPALIRRHSLWYIDVSISAKISKSGFENSDFFKSKNALESILLNRHQEESPVQETLFAHIEEQLSQLKNQIKDLDAPTQASITAEAQKISKSLEHIGQKIRKHQKSKLDHEIQLISKIKDSLFPEDKPQERHFNFLPYYFQWGENYFDALLERFAVKPTEFMIAEEIQGP
ncbi:MAG: bacillithiol biosynthesis cysteine-adding enzyme BshC [Saprospiraceae bacterium]|nr:bacillithiol biosynthesis cysteine-adding enzyme BshC [Saprospiraceae bacterium]